MPYSSKKKVLAIAAVLLAAAAIIYFLAVAGAKDAAAPVGQQEASRTPVNTVVYRCDNGKSITAAYFEGVDIPVVEGEMPNPTGSVDVSLDGGASMSLNQTLSASGIRYGNNDESFVFWSKGQEALIMRNNQMDLDYTNCRAAE
jgi:membrane-bound inhibitor of C-type lysozyme